MRCEPATFNNRCRSVYGGAVMPALPGFADIWGAVLAPSTPPERLSRKSESTGSAGTIATRAAGEQQHQRRRRD